MLNQKYMGLRTKDLIGADQRSDNNKIGQPQNLPYATRDSEFPHAQFFGCFTQIT